MGDEIAISGSEWKFRLRAWSASHSVVILVGVKTGSPEREILAFNDVDLVGLRTEWMTGLRITRATDTESVSRFPRLRAVELERRGGTVLESEEFTGFLLGAAALRKRTVISGEPAEEILAADEWVSDALRSDDEY